jgi:hypothetical protein
MDRGPVRPLFAPSCTVIKERITSGIGLDWRTVELVLNDDNSKTLQVASGVSLWHAPSHDLVRIRWVGGSSLGRMYC